MLIGCGTTDTVAPADAKGQTSASCTDGSSTTSAVPVSTIEFVCFDGWVNGSNVALRPFGRVWLIVALVGALYFVDLLTGSRA